MKIEKTLAKNTVGVWNAHFNAADPLSYYLGKAIKYLTTGTASIIIYGAFLPSVLFFLDSLSPLVPQILPGPEWGLWVALIMAVVQLCHKAIKDHLEASAKKR